MFEKSVFINCPIDDQYAPILEATLFTIVYLGFTPRIATERLEAGEARLDKIIELIRACEYSVHDLSMCISSDAGEYFRMNMPFELGIDLGLRKSGVAAYQKKKFLIFERTQYDLKKSLSDMAGQDPVFHEGKYEKVIKLVREFFLAEANCHDIPGPKKIKVDYENFQGWMTDKKLFEGHSKEDALALPTTERLSEMQRWMKQGQPDSFETDPEENSPL